MGWEGGEKYLSRGQGWRRGGSLSMLHYPRVLIRCFYPQQKGNTAASEEGTENTTSEMSRISTDEKILRH